MEINVDMLREYIDRHVFLQNEFGVFSKMYLMATENIREFLACLDLEGKEFLSVAGSGDQMLNAILMGAKGVTLFDINPLALAQAKLKLAAVTALEYEEFCEFFFPEFGNLFSRYLYDKVDRCLDAEMQKIFRYIFGSFENKWILMNFYYLFLPKISKQQTLNAYLEREAYNKLRKNIVDKRITFINADVKHLKKKIDKRLYDCIMLSNISDSIDKMYDKRALKHYRKLINSLSKNLTDDGIMEVGYIYSNYGGDDCPIPSFARDEEREKIFTPEDFKTQRVTGFRFYSDKDRIITYEHKKRKVS